LKTKQDNNTNGNAESDKKYFGRESENDLYFLKGGYDYSEILFLR
jgi:hypothetical protein